MRASRIHAAAVALAAAAVLALLQPAAAQRWTEERANAWYASQPWLVGANYAPAYAVNQLEMWQPDTFNLTAIDRELALAQDLGFTSLRVFLHDLLWRDDAAGLLERMDQFLGVASARGIGIMFVLFDGVWDPYPVAGPQPAPVPNVHNSRWVQGPGREILGSPARHDELEPYVVGVVSHFRNDSRVQVWDLFNEPDTPVPQYADEELPDKAARALDLLRKTFEWIRPLDPIQPLTAGVWAGDWSSEGSLSEIQRYQLDNSDVISFHNYAGPDDVAKRIADLRRYNRPILCTEYMARSAGSTFEGVMPVLAAENVGAYNWGFVDGKTQTIFPWDSWDREYTGEPDPWFHDVFREDGTPYSTAETDLIKSLTGAAARRR